MFWRRKKLKYVILATPLKKQIHLLSRAEAQTFFDWYISKLDERVDYLRSFTKINLDYSSNSLLPLWNWFLKNAEIEFTPMERLQKLENELILSKSPFQETVLAEKAKQFTLETEYIMQDIAMYFGEIFVKNHPSIYWGFYTSPKRDSFINHPVLMGFPNRAFPEKNGVPLVPLHMVSVQASKLLRGTATKQDLLGIYRIWENKILD